MGTDMRLNVEGQETTSDAWYSIKTLYPSRDYEAWRWLGRLGQKEPGVAEFALRGLPTDEDAATHRDMFFDEEGYSHSWCTLRELEEAATKEYAVWVHKLLIDLGDDVTERDPDTVRLVWSFAY